MTKGRYRPDEQNDQHYCVRFHTTTSAFRSSDASYCWMKLEFELRATVRDGNQAKGLLPGVSSFRSSVFWYLELCTQVAHRDTPHVDLSWCQRCSRLIGRQSRQLVLAENGDALDRPSLQTGRQRGIAAR